MTLATICKELKIDPADARVILRSLVKAKKLKHTPQGRWEWPRAEVASVKKQLMGKEPTKKPAKKATRKPAKKSAPPPPPTVETAS